MNSRLLWAWSYSLVVGVIFFALVNARSHNPYVRKELSTKWRKIAATRTLHPANLTAIEIIEELKTTMFKIRIIISNKEIKIYKDEDVVYQKTGVDNGYFISHTGFHVVVLHPLRGTVMLARQFLTHQPAESRNLATCLQGLAPGNLLLLAAVPDATMYLGPDAIYFLQEIGSRRIRFVARNEAWAMAAHTPERPYNPPKFYPILKPNVTKAAISLGRVWLETITTRNWMGKAISPDIDADTYIPKLEATECAWHRDPGMKAQRDFCGTYDGYIRLCKCESPVTPSLRHSAPKIDIREIIPVAMLTAIKPFNFYRQLLNLLETPGAAQTPIIVLIDGPQKEITRLARLFGLDVLIHKPQGEKGTSTLLNMHFRFSVHNVFNFFPDADKAIILEDDLLLSPDFLSFFQQTAWLLDEDPTISHINSFSVNSYPEVASNPTVLRRIEMFPQFGWMIKRSWAQDMFDYWVPENETADWDWWLNGERQRQQRDALIPELSRTFHAGAAGAHVTGWAQSHLFNHMVFNQDPNVKLKGLEDLISDKYFAKIKRDIDRALIINLTGSPCNTEVLPPDQPGPFKLYVNSKTKNDEFESFFVMQSCLRGYPEDTREMYRGTIRYNLNGRLLYVVGCPVSIFCSTSFAVNVLTPSAGLIDHAVESSTPWQQRKYNPYYIERYPPVSPEEMWKMENLIYIYHNGTYVYNKASASVVTKT